MNDPTCYVCGHTPEEQREEIRECEEPDCACGMFEPREDDDEEEDASRVNVTYRVMRG